MSNFWKTSDGSQLDNSGEFEIGGGEPLPEMTALAVITEAIWDSFENSPEHISLTWTVLEPAEYKNRKVFQKLKVNELDGKKRDKAIRMINAIDINAGNVIPRDGIPDDDDLSLLKHAIMPIAIKVWELDGKRGNWIAAVSSNRKKAAPAVAQVSKPTAVKPMRDDDIPF
jgi:hypothetical protein